MLPFSSGQTLAAILVLGGFVLLFVAVHIGVRMINKHIDEQNKSDE